MVFVLKCLQYDQEIEEACLSLKYNPDNIVKKDRALLIFDDVNKFDLSEADSKKAVKMLFNAVRNSSLP